MKSLMKLIRLGGLALLLFAGIWLLSRASGPTPESLERQQAIQSFAPVDIGNRDAVGEIVEQSASFPTTVNLADIPAGVYDPNNQYARWRRGEIDLQEEFSRLPESEMTLLQLEALELPTSANIQLAPTGPTLQAPTAGVSFDSIDFNECCGGGGNVPPDPELAVGPNHIIAVVNVAFEIYDKSGNSLSGPTTFASFMSSNSNCTGVFDPNALYDEREDRFILGIDANGTDYCIAISQTGDPTGSWNIYSFTTGSSTLFFDYPHVGVGNDAIYLGANIFNNNTNAFVDSRIWALDKAAMYSGAAASSVLRNLGSNDDTPQPLNLHGWNQGTWPTSGPHYFIAETGYDGSTHTIYSWSDPFGANSFSTVGTVSLNAATGVTAANTVAFPQSSGGTLQGNDFRPQDFEYRNGFAWTTMAIGCNPGSGTVNCVRWAQINPATATVADAGVYSSNGEYRQFPDLAVNHCDDMAVGYTKSSSSMFPGIYVTGRQSTDAAGTLQAEVLLKSGEISYTSFETSAPRRWGDYTEMTIDPNGTTFWYLGEYSKNTGTTQGRWGTYIGSYSFSSCTTGPTPTPGPTATATNPPAPTNTPVPGTCTVYNSTDIPKAISSSGTPSISSVLNISGSGTIGDINVLNLNGTHTWINDLDFNLSSPGGTSVQIMARSCSSQDNFDLNLDDEAAAGSWPCPPVGGGTYQPSNPLSAFDGQSANGTWTLTINDNANQDGGSLNGWSLEVCTVGAVPTATNTPPPPTATNTPLPTATNTPLPPTATNTPLPPTNTPLPPTATNTPLPPTATNTPLPPTATNTPAPPTPTPTTPASGTIFFDDFETSQGWTTDPNGTDTATTGQWERANPEDTNSSGPKQLGTTVSGSFDLVTGATAGSSVGVNDIDNGVTSIRSPNISLPTGLDLTLTFNYYLAHTSNSSSADFLRITAVGSSNQVLFEELGAANDDDGVWDVASVNLNAFAGQTIYLLVEAADAAGGSIVEAGIDDVEITAGAAPACTTYTSTNVPVALPNGTTTITSQLTVGPATTIADLDVTVNMAHAWPGDLSMVLTHQNTGTAVTFIDRPGVPASTYGCSTDNIQATLSDEAALPVENQCNGSAPAINGTFSPNNALSAFDGESSSGTWVLSVTDSYTSADAGTLNSWSITVCTP